MLNTNFQLAIAAIFNTISVVLAIAGIIILFLYERQCKKLDRQIDKEKTQQRKFSDMVEAKLDMEWN
jgi:hypothetical protein